MEEKTMPACDCSAADDDAEKRSRYRMKKNEFNWAFFTRFAVLLRLMYPRWSSVTVPLTFLVLFLGIMNEVVTYTIGMVSSEFYLVLGGRDQVGYYNLVLKVMFITIGKALMLSSLKCTSYLLFLHWRRLITTKMHSLYLRKFVFYHICQTQHEIDNPDQRIAQDVEKTSLSFSQIFVSILLAPFIIVFYMYKTTERTGYIGPVAVIVYFIVATILNKFFMSPVAKVVFVQERKEGNFRYKHVAIRNNAEAIAFYNAAALEKHLTDRELKSLLTTQQTLMLVQFPLYFIINFFDYFGAYLSYMIVGLTIFNLGIYDGVSSLGLTAIISQNSFIFMYLINSFSRLLDLAQQVSQMAGTTHRTPSAASSNSESKENGGKLESASKIGENVAFRLDNVSFRQPHSNVLLLKGLTLDICLGRHMLITGDSGCGKTSLLRVLRGFWDKDSGTFVKNLPLRLPAVFFSPQKPYFPTGSLRQQIVYPVSVEAAPTDAAENFRLDSLLSLVKLEHLVLRANGYDTEITWDWASVLTPGEMQRLSVLRVLYHKPQIAFLDEATSAVTIGLERDIYTAIQKEGITCVSVGHRDSLRRFHDLELHVSGNGSWTVTEIDKAEV